MRKKSTREQIVDAADQLFYQQGFAHTSFADIAGAVSISRGNFYHHFKAKDDILDSVIGARLVNTRAMLAAWEDASDDPAERIRSFINILIVNEEKISRYGCPVGTLTSELAKLNHTARGDANAVFTLFHKWLARQFTQLGLKADSDRLAMHLLARSQGVATMANAFPDPAFVRAEVKQMCDWLDARIDDAKRTGGR